MGRKDIQRFLKYSGIFLSPVIVLVALYFILDPFKVLRSYDSFYTSGKPTYVSLDRDYISTTMFDKNHEKYGYDAFIFGNSRSIFYQVADWKQHISPNSSPFHFDASGESLYGIEKKVTYVDKKQVPLKHALLVIDNSTLQGITRGEEHIVAVAPQLEPWSYIVPFHIKFIKAFFTAKFMVAYLDLKFTGRFKSYMKETKLLDDRPIGYILQPNEVFSPFEKLIAENKYYNEERMSVFYKRDSLQQTSPAAIGKVQQKMLKNIQDIFKKHNTEYRIIINPLYDQIKLNPADLQYLEGLFGQENVFDYSGINDITTDYHNYYEKSHYRPHIARAIMQQIYTQSPETH